MGRLDTANHYIDTLSIPEKIPAHGSAIISSFDAAIWSGNVFLTKTNYLKRIFKYWTPQACYGSVYPNMRETNMVTMSGNRGTSFTSS